MQFASPIPLWLAAIVFAATVAAAFFSYRRPLVPLSRVQRGALMVLRTLSLTAIVFFLCRPVLMMPPAAERGVVVPILVDVSRSMRVADADGQTRISKAVGLLERDLLPSLAQRFTPEVYAIGETVMPATPGSLSPDASRSDLLGALKTIAERSRGRRVSGVVLLSDGGDTTQTTARELPGFQGLPLFAIGIGSPDGPPDRELLAIAAADPRLDQSSVDLRVTATTSGFGRSPFQLRVLGNGRLLESRTVSSAGEGSPVDEVFTVSPDPLNPTVYTAEVAAGDGEAVGENNTRSILVSPAGRKRTVLAIVGAPGHEHSFMTRALAVDPALELDTIVRKGKNDNGEETFLVQAGDGRAPGLSSGFPASREALYFYDAIVIANVEGEFFTRAQLSQVAEFVSERGGGLLVLGGRSFARRGLIGTAIESVLPVELDERRSPTRVDAGVRPASHNAVAVTPEGQNHPATRIGASPEETRRLWKALPALAASAPLGGPKPGATVLAVTTAPGGAVYPVVAVQRYGAGRSMVFAGEASWRWRMMQPSDDRSFEYFWRGAVRWIGGASPDAVSVQVPEALAPGDSIDILVEARDRAFQAVPDAGIRATLTVPGGKTTPLTFRRDPRADGRFVASVRADEPGLHRVQADVRRGDTALGAADRWFYVGGADREFADPRLNERLLRRLALASNGRYVRASEASGVVSWLQEAAPRNAPPERRDLWHNPWAIALVIALLSVEWVLRRRWGLR
jgi:uncharacterized membrane protein